jgi:hypothetical protein
MKASYLKCYVYQLGTFNAFEHSVGLDTFKTFYCLFIMRVTVYLHVLEIVFLLVFFS